MNYVYLIPMKVFGRYYYVMNLYTPLYIGIYNRTQSSRLFK